jgi:hypothetical protein
MKKKTNEQLNPFPVSIFNLEAWSKLTLKQLDEKLLILTAKIDKLPKESNSIYVLMVETMEELEAYIEIRKQTEQQQNDRKSTIIT